MPPQSAGLLLHRFRASGPEVLLVHPGGPYYAKRDTGVWSVPKGLFTPEEDALAAAKREFWEETGYDPPPGPYYELASIRMKGGKTVFAWTAAGDIDTSHIRSNTFRMEYPYKSGRFAEYPEVDAAAWLGFDVAAEKIIPAQRPFLDAVQVMLRNQY